MSEVQKKVKLEAKKISQTKGHDHSAKKKWVKKRCKIKARYNGGQDGKMAVSWKGLSTGMCRYHVPSESQKKGASHDRTLTVMWQMTGCHCLVCATALPVLTTSPVSQNIKEQDIQNKHPCFSVACCCCSVAGGVGNCSVF